jgi:hypothetical protein
MTNWQPIETAPKDGSLFDAYDCVEGRRHTDFFWSEDWDSWYCWYLGCIKLEEHATHWMLQPEPPKKEVL